MLMENHIRIAELQNKIKDGIDIEANNILFEFKSIGDEGVELEIITINPKHHQSFLFHATRGRDKIEALEAMQAYVANSVEVENSYTIQWNLKGDNKLHTSYFRAKNIQQALDKFYYGRDVNSVNVFSVVLNPMS
jgi:hypothetical protein